MAECDRDLRQAGVAVEQAEVEAEAAAEAESGGSVAGRQTRAEGESVGAGSSGVAPYGTVPPRVRGFSRPEARARVSAGAN